MIDERQRFDEAVRRFAPPEHAFDRLVQRRTRKVRRQRLAAGAVAFAMVAAAFGLGIGIIRSGNQPAATPSAPAPTPTSDHRPGDRSPASPSLQIRGGHGVFVPPGATELSVHSLSDIVYVVDGRLVLSVNDGKALDRLTPGWLRVTQPSWSPDGSQISFAATGRDGSLDGIYVVDRNGTGLRRLTTSNADAEPDWSPDGTQLVFQRGRHLYTIPIGGGTPRFLVANGLSPAWSSPERIVFTRGTSTWEITANGGRPHRFVFEGA
jgi:hypothetical protein